MNANLFVRNNKKDDGENPALVLTMEARLKQLEERLSKIEGGVSGAPNSSVSGDEGDTVRRVLAEDTYNVMVVSKPFTNPWKLGLYCFILQAALISVVLGDMILGVSGVLDNEIRIPVRTDLISLRITQFLALFTVYIYQTDMLQALKNLFELDKSSDWKVLVELDDDDRNHNPSCFIMCVCCSPCLRCWEWLLCCCCAPIRLLCCRVTKKKEKAEDDGNSDAAAESTTVCSSMDDTKIWWARIGFPNVLKLIEGFLVLLVCLGFIMTSSSTIDLFKDFTALMVISEIDDKVFWFADMGYLGREHKAKTTRVKNTTVHDVVLPSNENRVWYKRCCCCKFPKSTWIVFICYLLSLLTWAVTMVLQADGTLLRLTSGYEDCNLEYGRYVWVGDGICDNSFDNFNTLECKWDGGDCDEYNRWQEVTNETELLFVG